MSAILSTVASLAKKAYTMWNNYQNAPDDIAIAVGDINGIGLILRSIQTRLINNPNSWYHQNDSTKQRNELAVHVKHCEKCMVRMEKFLSKYTTNGFWDNVKWAAAEARSEIQPLKLDVMMASINLSLSLKTDVLFEYDNALQGIAKQFKALHDLLVQTKNLNVPADPGNGVLVPIGMVRKLLIVLFFIARLKAIVIRKRNAAKKTTRPKAGPSASIKPGSQAPGTKIKPSLTRRNTGFAPLSRRTTGFRSPVRQTQSPGPKPKIKRRDSLLQKTCVDVMAARKSEKALAAASVLQGPLTLTTPAPPPYAQFDPHPLPPGLLGGTATTYNTIIRAPTPTKQSTEYLECWRVGIVSVYGFKKPKYVQHKRGQAQLAKFAEALKEVSALDKHGLNAKDERIKVMIEAKNGFERERGSRRRWKLVAARCVVVGKGTGFKLQKAMVVLKRVEGG